MTQRSMILSAFLAALVLVVIGGVVANLTEPPPAQLAQAEAGTSQPVADPGSAAEPEAWHAAYDDQHERRDDDDDDDEHERGARWERDDD